MNLIKRIKENRKRKLILKESIQKALASIKGLHFIYDEPKNRKPTFLGSPNFGMGKSASWPLLEKVVTFSSSGQTLVSGQEPSKLQKNWLLCFVDYMVSIGENPEDYTFELPNGQKATIFKTDSSYNYKLT